MAIVNQVQKKVRMDIWECVKIQFLVHCFIKNIKISDLAFMASDFFILLLVGIIFWILHWQILDIP